MLALRKIRSLDVEPDAASGRTFVSAASGLVRCGTTLYVVADDDLSLAVFDLDDVEPGRLVRLKPGRLPDEKHARKAAKPDFEVLMRLPSSPAMPGGALLALGSGSRPHRREAFVVPLDGDGSRIGRARAIDLQPVFALLDTAYDEPNTEGAAIAGDRMLFFQRGNAARPDNFVASFPLAELMALVAGTRVPLSQPLVSRVDLGAVDGVPLSVTDATALANGDIVVSAVAEDTPNAYDDGVCVGAALALLRARGRPGRDPSPAAPDQGRRHRRHRNHRRDPPADGHRRRRSRGRGGAFRDDASEMIISLPARA